MLDNVKVSYDTIRKMGPLWSLGSCGRERGLLAQVHYLACLGTTVLQDWASKSFLAQYCQALWAVETGKAVWF